MTTVELLERLRDVDEVLLLELLDLKSTDLVDEFFDRVYENEEYIRQYLGYD